MTLRKRAFLLIPAVLSILAAAHVCLAQEPAFKPYKASGTYALGEKVGWKVSFPQDVRIGDYQYVVRRNNLDVITSGKLSESTPIEVTLNEPAMVYVEITPPDGGKTMALGAAVAPEKLQPSIPRPKDFDDFWKTKIRLLEKTPENAVLTSKDSGRPDVEYSVVKMDNVEGAHIHGQLAKPKKPGKFPALLILQWASPPYPLQRQWVTDRAAEGWLTLNIEPHDVLPDQPQAYYDALPDALKHYDTIGRESRDTHYFLKMYLADYRAVEYLAKRPDWDGKTLVVMGTSMGGQQSLCVAGLNSRITHMLVNEPAGCDLNGRLHGRKPGYPSWATDDPKILAADQYFDAVNFASRIKATSLVAIGFVDTVTPPVGIWIAFNQIRGPKEAAPMVDSPHNHLATPEQQRPWTARSEEWLATIVKGEAINPRREIGDRVAASADWPIPRTDQNSQIAHTELLEKARKGGIDVYFAGDSITRRWGTSDEQYRHFLANWRQNFFGWNAGNFGWGGDTTQNILWRLNNGEIDDVAPKIVVVMAGTNNVGNESPQGSPDPRIADVTKGIKAILDVCRKKAPKATIVLMGITPRNDNMAVMPVIDAINRNIAKLADGKKVRYVNINDRLADKDGKLLEGMANRDGLHLDVGGYQVWADALKPIFTEILGPPAKEDHAPPPTGDPSARSRPAA